MRTTPVSQPLSRRAPRALLVLVAAAVMVAAALLPGGAAADQASQPSSPEAGMIATGNFHSCAVIAGTVRCWGYGGDAALGYGNTQSIGDDEDPAAAGPVALGAGRTAVAVAAGTVHTCALLDNGAVRCWGFGGDGRLGYGNVDNIGDDEKPADVPPVSFGPGRTAKAIAAGNGHTCAILEDDSVRCWGFNLDGRLGLGSVDSVGDDESPAQSPAVKLGPGRTAKAITAGGSHTCALLDNGAVRCWGFGGDGRLGYGKIADVGRFEDTTPDTVGPVNLGQNATAISAGFGHVCAILADASLRCWGFAGDGRLGYANASSIGDDEQPVSAGPVSVGGRVKAISSGFEHTCAVLDGGSVRCWGFGALGNLGYANTQTIGDDEVPSSVGPIGLGRAATAVSAGQRHTCARLDDGSVRCWGSGNNGRLGYCEEIRIGDDESPASAGPVVLGQPGIPGDGCPFVAPPPPPPAPPAGDIAVTPVAPAPPPPAVVPGPDGLSTLLAAERARAAKYSSCLRSAKSRFTADLRRARRVVGARGRLQRRLAEASNKRRRAACVKRHGRRPGPVKGLKAKATGRGKVKLSFTVAGSDNGKAPAARGYLVKQSLKPIRTARDFKRAAVLCKGRCAFYGFTSIETTAELEITDLVPGRLYHYAVAARDNVSSRVGPRSRSVAVRALRKATT